jgi:hypothetical protein
LFYPAIAPAAQLLCAEQQTETAANAQPADTRQIREPQALDVADRLEIQNEVQHAAEPALPPVASQLPEPELPATRSSGSLQSIRATPERYNFRANPRPSLRNNLFMIIALIMLLPLVTCASFKSTPLVSVARAGHSTFNMWSKLGSMATWSSMVLPVILALVSMLHIAMKWTRKSMSKCKTAALNTPSRVLNAAGKQQEVCGCGRVDSNDPHLTI